MGRPNKSALKKPIWEEPPAPEYKRPVQNESPWVRLRRELMRNPNKWACISIHTSVSTASATRCAIIKRGIFPAGEFELVTRTVKGKGRLYARYVITHPAPSE